MRKNIKRIVILCIVLFSGFALTACTSTTSVETGNEKTANTEDPILIGIYQPLSGPSAFCGQQAVNGALMAVEEINEKGGVLGRQLKLIVEDNENDVTKTVTVVTKLITQDNVNALAGDYFSACTIAGMEIAAEHSIANICGIPASPRITNSGNEWIFRTSPTDAMNAATYVKFMVEERGNKTFLFMANDGEFGREAVIAYRPVLEEYNAEILEEMYFSENDLDFNSQITRIKQLNPDVVVLVSGGSAGALFCKQAKGLGLNSEIMGLGTQAEQEFIDTAGEGSEGVFCATTYVHTIDTPENKVFVDKYYSKYNDYPSEYSLSEYRNLEILAQAIERAGTDDPTAIRDALRETDYMGIAGPVQFDDNGQSYPWIFITQIVDGKLTVAVKAETFKVE